MSNDLISNAAAIAQNKLKTEDIYEDYNNLRLLANKWSNFTNFNDELDLAAMVITGEEPFEITSDEISEIKHFYFNTSKEDL